MIAADILGGMLRINLAAGVAILGVVALRKWFRPRFGARLAYGLWLLPLLASAAVMSPARQVVVLRLVSLRTAAAAGHQPWLASGGMDPLSLLLGLLLVGVAGAVLVMVQLQRRFMNRASAGAVGPAVVGVIAPRIVTPRDFADRYSRGEQALVLAHERAHIARQDSRLNGLCAATQCLFWFNPLVHLAARLMRIDQELACDEAVVARFPQARRAYAEVLLKAQLATVPLPLGCYWPSTTDHPLVERVAMLRRRAVGGARRSAGLAVLAVLCSGAGLAAWAARPTDVRIAISPAEAAQPLKPSPIAAAGGRMARHEIRALARGVGPLAPSEHEVTANSALDPAPDEAVPSAMEQRLPAAQAKHTLHVLDAEDASALRLAEVQVRPAGDQGAAPASEPSSRQQPLAEAQLAAVTPASERVQRAYPADDPDQVSCQVEPVTGSRFLRRVCMTRTEWNEQQRRLFDWERHSLLDPSGAPALSF